MGMTPHEVDAYFDTLMNWEHQCNQSALTHVDLSRMQALMVSMNFPGLTCPVVHVAGSKGKGSTCAFVASILKEAGYRVGLYTSPHLTHRRERIRILEEPSNGVTSKDIFPDAWTPEQEAAQVTWLRPYIEKGVAQGDVGAPSFYEVYTALALWHFKAQQVDCVVLETGLGGRLDATNVVPAQVVGITSIGLEHTAILGETVTQIAAEKAAIIKQGTRHVRCAPQSLEVEKVIHARCASLGLDLVMMHGERARQYEDIQLGLLGAHQWMNANLAIGLIEALQEEGLTVTDEAMSKGLVSVVWPGRLEVLQESPTLVLDGAHSPASAACLVEAVNRYWAGQRIVLVLALSVDKDHKSMAQILAPIVNEVILTKACHPRAAHLTEAEWAVLFPRARRYHRAQPREALALARQRAQSQDVILVTGSLFIVAEVRELCTNLKV